MQYPVVPAVKALVVARGEPARPRVRPPLPSRGAGAAFRLGEHMEPAETRAGR